MPGLPRLKLRWVQENENDCFEKLAFGIDYPKIIWAIGLTARCHRGLFRAAGTLWVESSNAPMG